MSPTIRHKPSRCQTIYGSSYTFLSIESVNLKINKELSGDDGGCEIYGKITVDGRCKRYYVYRRSEEEAETIPIPEKECEEGFDLTLCGPNYYLNADATYCIYIDLFHKSGKPLLDGTLGFYHPVHRWPENNKPSTLVLYGDQASLTIYFTRICPAVTTDVGITVIGGAGAGGAKLVVYGTIKAIQTMPGGRGITRCLTLFQSESGVELQSGESTIPLDRSVVVAPVQLKELYEEETWGWLSIAVHLELELSLEEGQKNYKVEGEEKFEFKGDEKIGTLFQRIIENMNNEDGLKVEVGVTPFFDYFYNIDDLEGEPHPGDVMSD